MNRLTERQLEDMANCANHGCDSCTAKDTVGGACQIASAQTALIYREMLERLEWVEVGERDGEDGMIPAKLCPSCDNWKEEGHKPDCELAALLKGLEE